MWLNIHRLAIKLKPLTGAVKNTDYLVTMTHFKGWGLY